MSFLLSLPVLNDEEKKAFRCHMLYQVVEGVIFGVLALNEFVFIKSLLGTNYQLGFLFQFSVVVFIFLIVFNEFRKRIKNKKKLLIWTGILTRAPLFLLIFFPRSAEAFNGNSGYHYMFLFIFLVYYFGNIIIFPAINVLLKTNYRHMNFGKLYSYTTSVNKIVMLLTTLIYGIMLDADNYAFVYVFPFIAFLGIMSLFILANIDYSKVVQHPRAKTLKESIKASIKTMGRILKNNKPYRHFEIGFMFYGFSFMITITVISIFFNDELNLNYSSVAFYKNAYNIIAIIILPFFGKLMGNIDPRKFASISFASLLLYVFFLLMTDYFPDYYVIANIRLYPMLVVSFLFYGVFAATMVLLWNIGSAYFCKPVEADDYQSVHLSLTGVRALFAPLLGIFFYELIGFTGTFLVAILSLMIAIFLMRWSYIKDKVR